VAALLAVFFVYVNYLFGLFHEEGGGVGGYSGRILRAAHFFNK
jgi:hypothetical protein